LLDALRVQLGYRFADCKEKVIDLLKSVTPVSVETMKVVEATKAKKR
jgi:predicted helicase